MPGEGNEVLRTGSGAHAAAVHRRNRAAEAAATTTTPREVQAISFFRPFWELCFQGRLMIGDYAVKTFSQPYHGRGLRLCHSGIKTACGSMRAWDFKESDIPMGVVGCVMIEDCRELTDK